jgi:hypothetical protein
VSRATSLCDSNSRMIRFWSSDCGGSLVLGLLLAVSRHCGRCGQGSSRCTRAPLSGLRASIRSRWSGSSMTSIA